MQIKLKYLYKDYKGNYEVRELLHECDPNLSDGENFDNAFVEACKKGADPQKNIQWKYIE